MSDPWNLEALLGRALTAEEIRNRDRNLKLVRVIEWLKDPYRPRIVEP